MLRTSIITRVLVAVFTVVTAFAAALAYNVSSQQRLVAQLARINDGYVPISRRLEDLGREVRSFARVVSNKDPVVLRQSMRASMALFPFPERIEQQLESLREQLTGLSDTQLSEDEDGFVSNTYAVAELLSLENRELAVMADELLLLLDEVAPRIDPLHTELSSRITAFEKRVDDLGSVVERRTDAAVDRVRAAQRRSMVRVGYVSLGAVFIALISVLLIRRSLRPIRQLTGLATQLKEGDYQFPPIEAGRDEIGVLAREFTGMADAIRDRDGLLRRQKDELEDAYRALVEAQRAQVQAERLAAVGEISSRITHELRNPLSSIGLNVEMLVDELENDGRDGDGVEMLRAIEREVQRLTELTDRYLSMTRTDAERRVDAALGDLVDDVAGQLQPELERAGIGLEHEAADGVSVRVDPAQLRQVLINLVQNSVGAIRSTRDAGGRIRIRVTAHDEHALCRIEDDGPGIDAAIAGQVFEPFVTNREGGTGLGLSISRRIVEDHDGELRAGTSDELGGAAFELRLPRTRV